MHSTIYYYTLFCKNTGFNALYSCVIFFNNLLLSYQTAAERAKRAREVERNKNLARLSLLDMEIEQDKGGAHIASPVAWGYGPALAMPTLMGMMGEQEEADAGQDGGQVSVTT